jgi:hypothetical protein
MCYNDARAWGGGDMTVVVAVKVNDGLVLAADSAVAVHGGPTGQPPGILKTYDYGRKLSHIKDYPIGTLSWGVSLLGSRTIESLINEYEFSLPPAKDAGGFQVREIADNLRAFLQERYEVQYGPLSPRGQPSLGVLVSGYSDGRYFPEQYLFEFPATPELQVRRPNKENGEPDFGVDWFGLTDAITRLIKGADPRLATVFGQRLETSPDEAWQSLAQFEYPIAFEGMPLQDAIDLAVYLVEMTIGRYRFVVGAPLCGGAVDVAVVTPRGFTWVYRKNWRAIRQGGADGSS